MAVPLKKGSPVVSSTANISDAILKLQQKGLISSCIIHSRRDVLEKEHEDQLDQLFFGVFLGTDYKLNDSWSLNLEGRFVDETAMSFAAKYKF